MLAKNWFESIEAAPEETIGNRGVVMSLRGRRVCLMIGACMLGGSLALVTSSVIKWERGAIIIFALALIAGISTLWSP